LTVGVETAMLRYLDALRKKRNLTGYERIGAVSDREVEEIVKTAATMRSQVEEWIRDTHPELL